MRWARQFGNPLFSQSVTTKTPGASRSGVPSAAHQVVIQLADPAQADAVAAQLRASLGEGYEEGKDAEISVALEILPQIEAPSLDGLKLEKLVTKKLTTAKKMLKKVRL